MRRFLVAQLLFMASACSGPAAEPPRLRVDQGKVAARLALLTHLAEDGAEEEEPQASGAAPDVQQGRGRDEVGVGGAGGAFDGDADASPEEASGIPSESASDAP